MMMSPSTTPSSGNDVSMPAKRHWCSVCSIGFCSAEDLEIHKTWRNHSIRPELDDGIELWPCEICNRNFNSFQALRQHVSGRNHRLVWSRLSRPAQHPSEQKPLFRTTATVLVATSTIAAEKDTAEANRPWLEALEQSEKVVEFSKVHDEDRMKQQGYDDQVVELALHQYESFHGMMPGTATFAQVLHSSAGIFGWAVSSVDAVQSGTSSMEEKAETAVKWAAPGRKGDHEEEEMIRRAIMESLLESHGVCPAVRPVWQLPDNVMPNDDDSSCECQEGFDRDHKWCDGSDSVVTVNSVQLHSGVGSLRFDDSCSEENWSQISEKDHLCDAPVMVDVCFSLDEKDDGTDDSWTVVDDTNY